MLWKGTILIFRLATLFKINSYQQKNYKTHKEIRKYGSYPGKHKACSGKCPEEAQMLDFVEKDFKLAT